MAEKIAKFVALLSSEYISTNFIIIAKAIHNRRHVQEGGRGGRRQEVDGQAQREEAPTHREEQPRPVQIARR